MSQISKRRVSAVALLLGLPLWFYILNLPDPQAEWLRVDYGLTPDQLALWVSVGIVAWALVFLFEPRIRQELRDSGALPLIIGAALTVSVVALTQLSPDQPQRFARPVMSLTFALGLVPLWGGLAVMLALDTPTAAPTPRMRHYALIVALIVLALMVIIGAGTVNRFPRMNDFFDEIFAASMMTNYVETGNFCPSLSACAFGENNPFFARWLLWNGIWAKALGNTDMLTLRLFNIVAAGVLLGLFAAVLRWLAKLDALAVTVGVALVASASVFVRSSHNLRMDVGLGLYGVLILAALLWLDRLEPSPRRLWIVFAGGMSFYLGLETVPTVALMFGVSVGMLLIAWALMSPRKMDGWWLVLTYAGGAALASALYIIVRFVPNTAEQWENFQGMQTAYLAMGSIGSVFFPSWQSAHRFSLVMSPIEVVTVYGALLGLWWMGSRWERGLVLMVGFAQIVTYLLVGSSFGYHMVFLPIVGYAAARVIVRWRVGLLIGAFVVLPSMAAPMLNDMVSEYRLDINNRLIAELDLLTWRVPEGATVIGDDMFWLTLYDKADYISHTSVIMYTVEHDITREQFLEHAQPDMVICRPDLQSQVWLCDLAELYFDDEPEPFTITDGTFLIYQR